MIHNHGVVAVSYSSRSRVALLLVRLAAACSFATSAHATITWSTGTNTVGADMTLQDTEIVITGGTNTVQGLAGPPAGTTSGGTLRLIGGGTGLKMTGAAVTLNSDNTSPGRLLLQGNVSTFASATTALIITGGSATNPGNLDLSSATRLFTIAAGSVASAGPDLSITASITDGGLEKAGPGIIALSGANSYSGGTMLDAGTFYINSATAIGTEFFTVNGPNTAIDNTSGAPITLANNNQFNLSGGDLNFIGTNDMNLGTGILVMSNANRTINVANSGATLTVGGRIQDAGQNLSLTKAGAGTLVLDGNSLFNGTTDVSAGSLVLNGSLRGNVSVSGMMSGAGTIHGSLVVNNGGIVNVDGGTLTVDGAITNNGTFVLKHGGMVTSGSGFVNNAVLDLITAGSTPSNLTNNGTIIDASVVKTKTASLTGSTMTVMIDSYTGHNYQLQKSTTTPDAASFTINVGSSQQGSTGNVLTFTDSSASGSKSFYRIAVDP